MKKFLVMVFFVFFFVGFVFAAPRQITSAGADLITIPRYKIFQSQTDPNTIWAIFPNGGGNNLIKSINGGLTWDAATPPISIQSWMTDHSSLGGDNLNNLYIADRCNTACAESTQLFFRKINSPANMSGNLGPQIIITAPISGAQTPNILVQDSSNVFIIIRNGGNANGNIYYARSTDGGISFGTPQLLYATGAIDVRIGSLLINGMPAVILQYEVPIGNPNIDYQYFIWNGNQFVQNNDSLVVTGESTGFEREYSMSYVNGELHLVYNNLNRLRHAWKVYNNGQGTWSYENIEMPAYDPRDWHPSLTKHGNDLYLFYVISTDSSNHINTIYYRKYNFSTHSWNPRTQIGAANQNYQFPHGPAEVPVSSAFIPVIWSANSNSVWFDTISTSSQPPANLTIDSNFDSARIEAYTTSTNEVNFSLFDDNVGYYYWTNFKVSDVQGKTVTFNIMNAINSPFFARNNANNQIVYSCDGGTTWNRITNRNYNSPIYTFTQTFSCNAAQISTFFPFSYADMQNYILSISSSPYVNATTIGLSTEGRNIDLLQITNFAVPDSGKVNLFIISRQHAQELPASHMIKGLINFLISNDPIAISMRDRFIFHIIPMVNPDGVYAGYNRLDTDNSNMNRAWDGFTSDEVNIVRSKLDEINSQYGVDMFFDWHGQIWDLETASPSYLVFNDTFPIDFNFYNNLSNFTGFDNYIFSPYLNSPGVAATYGLSRNINSMTLEPSPHYSTWTIDNLMQEGVGFAYAIDNTFLPAQQSCTLFYDQVPCDCINNVELGNAVSGWFKGDIELAQLVQHVNVWRTSSGC